MIGGFFAMREHGATMEEPSFQSIERIVLIRGIRWWATALGRRVPCRMFRRLSLRRGRYRRSAAMQSAPCGAAGSVVSAGGITGGALRPGLYAIAVGTRRQAAASSDPADGSGLVAGDEAVAQQSLRCSDPGRAERQRQGNNSNRQLIAKIADNRGLQTDRNQYEAEFTNLR